MAGGLKLAFRQGFDPESLRSRDRSVYAPLRRTSPAALGPASPWTGTARVGGTKGAGQALEGGAEWEGRSTLRPYWFQAYFNTPRQQQHPSAIRLRSWQAPLRVTLRGYHKHRHLLQAFSL